MTDCDHSFDVRRIDLEDVMGLEHDTGLPQQVTGTVTCEDCGDRVDVDYNLAFIDGDKA